MAQRLSRQLFVLSGFSAAALAACGKSSTLSPNPPLLQHDGIYDLMRKAGCLAFWDKNGAMTALPGSIFAPGPVPSPGSGRNEDDCGVSSNVSTRSSDICFYTDPTPAPTPPPLSYNFYVVGDWGVNASPFPGTSGVVGLQGFGPHGPGPIYVGASNGNCVGESLVSAGSVANAMVTWIQAKGGQILQDSKFWIASFTAGEITAVEFISAILATLATWEVLAILAGITLVVGGVWVLYKCLHG